MQCLAMTGSHPIVSFQFPNNAKGFHNDLFSFKYFLALDVIVSRLFLNGISQCCLADGGLIYFGEIQPLLPGKIFISVFFP